MRSTCWWISAISRTRPRRSVEAPTCHAVKGHRARGCARELRWRMVELEGLTPNELADIVGGTGRARIVWNALVRGDDPFERRRSFGFSSSSSSWADSARSSGRRTPSRRTVRDDEAASGSRRRQAHRNGADSIGTQDDGLRFHSGRLRAGVHLLSHGDDGPRERANAC